MWLVGVSHQSEEIFPHCRHKQPSLLSPELMGQESASSAGLGPGPAPWRCHQQHKSSNGQRDGQTDDAAFLIGSCWESFAVPGREASSGSLFLSIINNVGRNLVLNILHLQI